MVFQYSLLTENKNKYVPPCDHYNMNIIKNNNPTYVMFYKKG